MKTTAFLKKVLLVIMVATLACATFACSKKGSSESKKESVIASESASTSVSASTSESTSASESASTSESDSSVSEPVSEPEGDYNVAISISIDKDEITVGQTASLTVEVTGTDNPIYTISFSEEGIIAVNNGIISIVSEEFTIAKRITITATADADNSKSASAAITVRPARIEGQVGELTSDMLVELGNQSITVTGTLTDIYTDFNQPIYSGSTTYDMVVYMEDGKWSGSWNRAAIDLFDEPVVITDIYARSEKDGYQDSYGNVGHAMERILINKNNEVERRMVKDYMSVPAIWEAQHLYNHLDQLSIDKFEYDPENDVYEYRYDSSDMDDVYLMTYLSYSLTPLLADTLDKLYFVVEDGAITKLIAYVPTAYVGEWYDENNNVHYDAMTETMIELTFSDIGSTVVADPAPFEGGDYNDLLKSAIAEMAGARNYTFQAIDTSTYSASGDAGDYEIMSVGGTSADLSIGNNTSATGTVGLLGHVTEDAILLADTGKYSYSMDDKLYHTEYTGYKNNGDGTYDHFAYDSKIPGFYGTKRVTGSVSDVLPTFNFASELFIYDSSFKKGSVTYYVFKLRESAINRDIAMEVSMHENADDAAADAIQEFTITISETGHLYETVYSYDLVSGTYLGNITTRYSSVGTTVLDEDLFDGYVPRKVMDSWDDYNVKYYTSSPTGGIWEDVTADVVLQAMFGDEYANIPPVSDFVEIFGDNLNGPFYDWIVVGTDDDGNNLYRGKLNFNTSATEYDENAKITNLDAIYAELEEMLTGYGFTKSKQNSGASYGNSYICFIKGDVQIYVENNGTKHLWIYFCTTGDWTLKRA